ncbi:hypothetical protein ADILRU_1387 [Leifsonia rubra CMS 76R]|nr:hypothetical protein ADILRU_1387 [Leifsonia rubra CMS 76R]
MEATRTRTRTRILNNDQLIDVATQVILVIKGADHIRQICQCG